MHTFLPPKPFQRWYNIGKITLNLPLSLITHPNRVRNSIEKGNGSLIRPLHFVRISLSPYRHVLHGGDLHYFGLIFRLIKFFVFFFVVKNHLENLHWSDIKESHASRRRNIRVKKSYL